MSIEFTYFLPSGSSQDSFIYPLTIILFLFACIAFIRSNFDILNPSFIYSSCIAGCCFLAAIYTDSWNLPMHFDSAIIILVMSIFFYLGSILAGYANNFNDVYTELKTSECQSGEGFFINPYVWLLLLIIVTYFVYLNYLDFLAAARQVTNETSFTKMLFPVIDGLSHQQIELSRWNAQRMRISQVIAYISVMAVWMNLKVHNYKEISKWCVFIILYIPFMVLTGGRQQFLYLIIFSVMSYFLISRRICIDKHSLRKEFTIIGSAVIIFLIFFLGIGVINGKIGNDSSVLKVLVHYAGTNISAFDVYLNEMLIPDNQYIGTLTLGSIYRFLQNIGFHGPQYIQYISVFTAFGPVTTNVYTAFFRYIQDFGCFGCALIMFILGFFYMFIYQRLYYYGLKNWMILIYCSIAYPIFLIGREERFFREILASGNFTFIVEALIFYNVFRFLSKKRN